MHSAWLLLGTGVVVPVTQVREWRLRGVLTCPESPMELGHSVLLLTELCGAAVVPEETLVREKALGWLDLEWLRRQDISWDRRV